MGNNKPVHKVRARSIVASIFRNSGKNGPFHNYTLARIYKTEAGWRSTHSFRPQDTWEVMAVCVQAEAWIRDEERPPPGDASEAEPA